MWSDPYSHRCVTTTAPFNLRNCYTVPFYPDVSFSCLNGGGQKSLLSTTDSTLHSTCSGCSCTCWKCFSLLQCMNLLMKVQMKILEKAPDSWCSASPLIDIVTHLFNPLLTLSPLVNHQYFDSVLLHRTKTCWKSVLIIIVNLLLMMPHPSEWSSFCGLQGKSSIPPFICDLHN